MKLLLIIRIQIILLISIVKSENILFFFAIGTYSHRIPVWPLVEKLVEHGHDVTFLQPYHPKKSTRNVKEFFPPGFQEYMKNRSRVTNGEYDLLTQRLKLGRVNDKFVVVILESVALTVCEKLVGFEETGEFIRNSKFDLVILDGLFNECGLGFAHKFGAKVMIYSTSTMFSWNYDPFGIPVESSWIPEIHYSFPYPMSFLQRVKSTLIIPLNYLYRKWYYYPKLEEILRSGLNIPNMPAVEEMEQNISLILLNAHFSEEVARSLPPFVVPVGGMHVDIPDTKNEELPEDIAKFVMNSGDEGFIFVSFGSTAKIKDAPEALQKIFYETFRKCKTQFIWKWEGKRPIDMPDNVLTAEWMPQQAILSHPKIKAFITHGGLMSIQEAILSEVPLIVFPIFAEQDYNSYRVERMGRGIRLEIQTLTGEELYSAISEILTNQSYKENMKKTAILFKDRPERPLDTALWWTEYVLRHDDLSHLKPLSMHQTWFQRRLLDVWLFILILILSALFTMGLIFKKIFAFLFFRNLNQKFTNVSGTKSKKN